MKVGEVEIFEEIDRLAAQAATAVDEIAVHSAWRANPDAIVDAADRLYEAAYLLRLAARFGKEHLGCDSPSTK